MHGTINSGFRVEIRRLDELAAFATELRDLAARAIASNAFYEPAFMAASAPVFGRDVLAGLVWRRAAPARLIGFFPVAIERRRYGLSIPMLVGWTHPYGPLGTPLIDRDGGEAAVAAWLDHVATDPALPKLVLMPYLPAEGDIAQAFDAALAHRKGRSEHFALHRRAMLAPAGDRAGYLDHAMAHKKRKELRRQRKRLADTGALTSTTSTDPAALTAALAGFPGAGSRRLERSRRHRGEAQRRRPLLRRRGRHRIGRRRQGLGRTAGARRPRHRRHRDAALRRRRVVLEDRL